MYRGNLTLYACDANHVPTRLINYESGSVVVPKNSTAQ